MNVKNICLDENIKLRFIGGNQDAIYLYGYNNAYTKQYIYCYKSNTLYRILETDANDNISEYWDETGENLYFIHQKKDKYEFYLNVVDNDEIKFLYKYKTDYNDIIDDLFVVNKYVFVKVKDYGDFRSQLIMIDLVNNKHYQVKGIDFIWTMASLPNLFKKDDELYVAFLKSYAFPYEVPQIRESNLSIESPYMCEYKLICIKFDLLIDNIKKCKDEYEWTTLIDSKCDEYIDFLEIFKNSIMCIKTYKDKKYIFKIDANTFEISKYSINSNINYMIKTDDNLYFINYDRENYTIHNVDGSILYKDTFNNNFYDNNVYDILNNKYIVISGFKEEGDEDADDRRVHEIVDMTTGNKVYHYDIIMINDSLLFD